MDRHASRTTATATLVDRRAPWSSVSTFKAVTVFIYLFQLNISSHYEYIYSKSLLPPQGEHIWNLKWTGPNQFMQLNLCCVVSRYVYRNVYIEIGIKSMESLSFLFHALLCSSTLPANLGYQLSRYAQNTGFLASKTWLLGRYPEYGNLLLKKLFFYNSIPYPIL